MACIGRGIRMDTKQQVAEMGFPTVAAHLDGTPEGARRALRELARFKPASFGEALAKSRAMKALPEIVELEDGIAFW
jgi:hypothetical protein